LIHDLLVIEEECPRIPRRGWADIIRKVYELDPIRFPQCQGQMRIIAFLTVRALADRIIKQLKLAFVAERPPPPHIVYQELLMAAGERSEWF
jgi:hypothetical protein